MNIDTNIPIPHRGGREGSITDTLRKLEVGHSFECECSGQGIHTMAKVAGIKITVRKTGPRTYRIWRIK